MSSLMEDPIIKWSLRILIVSSAIVITIFMILFLFGIVIGLMGVLSG